MLLNDPILVRITARGQPLELSLGVQVLSLSYEDVEKGDDMLNIIFSDPYMRLIDSKQFNENTEWSVQWGFPKKMHPPRKVFVKRPKYRFGETEVEALDKGSQLRLEENWHTYENLTMQDIVADIAKKYKLVPQTDSELKNVVQFFACGGRTDYEILQYLQSRLTDHVFKVLHDRLIFQRRQLEGPPLGTFEYKPGRDSRLLSFEVSTKDQDNAKSAKQTTTVGVDPMSFRKIVFKADESTTNSSNLGNRRPHDNYKAGYTKNIPDVSQLVTSGGRAVNVRQGNSTGKSLVVPATNNSEATAIAKGKRRSSLLNSIEATFDIVASPEDPFYKSGDLIEIRGIGKKYSGIWRIVKITHDLSSGYTYKITADRNAVNSVSGAGRLNGGVNKRNRINPDFLKVNTTIKGSISGKNYGSSGGSSG